MIRKLAYGEYRLYSRKQDPRTGKRRDLATFKAGHVQDSCRGEKK